MKKLLLFIAITVCAIGMVSCNSKTKKISVTDVQVYGNLYYTDSDDWFSSDDEDTEDYLFIENGTYKFYIQGNALFAKIPIKTLKQLPDIRIKESELGILIGDKDGESIKDSNNKEVLLFPENQSALNDLINSKVGNKTTIIFKYDLNGKSELLNKIETFCLFAELDCVKGSGQTKTSNKDWDAVLDSYEKYVNNYISFAKKATQGDFSAMEKLPSLMEDAEELSDRLEDASNDLTAEQTARYMRITAKFGAAMIDL